MIYLSLALLLLGTVTALNLVLILAVIRRLRRHEEERKQPHRSLEGFGNLPSGPPVGEPLPVLSGVALDGSTVTSDALRGREAALTFLSTDCSACVAAAGDLPEFARRTGMDVDQMVVVIAGDEETARSMAAPLAGVARVLLEASSGPLTTGYAIKAAPTTVMVDPDGTVTYAEAGTHPVLDQLPA
ncbi:TlpA family protein disulfide reductase [Streptomyces sp. NPDC127068]|uniref:TlpA family protein disulfide reductase n=1 Tax=Streptomyces sp. NPDC127068 TaxID=3347127 RepID=UPI00365CAEA7